MLVLRDSYHLKQMGSDKFHTRMSEGIFETWFKGVKVSLRHGAVSRKIFMG